MLSSAIDAVSMKAVARFVGMVRLIQTMEKIVMTVCSQVGHFIYRFEFLSLFHAQLVLLAKSPINPYFCRQDVPKSHTW